MKEQHQSKGETVSIRFSGELVVNLAVKVTDPRPEARPFADWHKAIFETTVEMWEELRAQPKPTK